MTDNTHMSGMSDNTCYSDTMQVMRLSIPPRTVLETVWRTVDTHTGIVSWHVVTNTPDRNQLWPFTGTALQLCSDGEAVRYTNDACGDERIMSIMPPV